MFHPLPFSHLCLYQVVAYDCVRQKSFWLPNASTVQSLFIIKHLVIILMLSNTNFLQMFLDDMKQILKHLYLHSG